MLPEITNVFVCWVWKEVRLGVTIGLYVWTLVFQWHKVEIYMKGAEVFDWNFMLEVDKNIYLIFRGSMGMVRIPLFKFEETGRCVCYNKWDTCSKFSNDQIESDTTKRSTPFSQSMLCYSHFLRKKQDSAHRHIPIPNHCTGWFSVGTLKCTIIASSKKEISF